MLHTHIHPHTYDSPPPSTSLPTVTPTPPPPPPPMLLHQSAAALPMLVARAPPAFEPVQGIVTVFLCAVVNLATFCMSPPPTPSLCPRVRMTSLHTIHHHPPISPFTWHQTSTMTCCQLIAAVNDCAHVMCGSQACFVLNCAGPSNFSPQIHIRGASLLRYASPLNEFLGALKALEMGWDMSLVAAVTCRKCLICFRVIRVAE